MSLCFSNVDIQLLKAKHAVPIMITGIKGKSKSEALPE